MIFVIDFGSQTTHLIARRLKDIGCPSRLIDPENALELIKKEKPQGIILSGGPSSVYEKNAPSIDKEIFSLNIPIFGICYGFQLTAHVLGGKVVTGRKEYGPGNFTVLTNEEIFQGIKKKSTIWLSHGDEIIRLPTGFKVIGSTSHVPNTAAVNKKTKQFMVQFHPEIEHTQEGEKILKNFIAICGIKTKKQSISPKQIIDTIRATVGKERVIGAISGGVDSVVAGVLVAKAIGKQFLPVFVNNGLQRDTAKTTVLSVFKKYGITPHILSVEKEILACLQGKTDAIEKRKIIGKFYIDMFEREVEKLRKLHVRAKFLVQGTIYSDVIESKGTKHASQIRVHHNVAGLPENMNLTLLEPLREFYKDEVRALGRKLGLPNEVTQKQAFPGPGYAVRIRGEVTHERLAKERQADNIVLEELEKTGWLKKVHMSFPVMTNSFSTATKGDGKAYGEVIALRVIESLDIMSANWSKLPYDLLQKISSRIVNEVPDISRVVYDITTKPPATMEWE